MNAASRAAEGLDPRRDCLFRDDHRRCRVLSITFCTSLSYNNYDNNISRILENVLRRFASSHP
jgi:hypothetical protein